MAQRDVQYRELSSQGILSSKYDIKAELAKFKRNKEIKIYLQQIF
jgi:hypothetical protein